MVRIVIVLSPSTDGAAVVDVVPIAVVVAVVAVSIVTVNNAEQ
ncbi:MAG: hypothetical protein ACTSV3_06560 [Candidatus Thorarchaeota archaeon]